MVKGEYITVHPEMEFMVIDLQKQWPISMIFQPKLVLLSSTVHIKWWENKKNMIWANQCIGPSHI
jgi:hypothetical protein